MNAMTRYLHLLLLLITKLHLALANSCTPQAPSCALLPAASSASCLSFFASNMISTSSCKSTSTVTPSTATKTVTCFSTSTSTTSITDTRTIQQTKQRSSTTATMTATDVLSSTTTITTSPVVSTETNTETDTATATIIITDTETDTETDTTTTTIIITSTSIAPAKRRQIEKLLERHQPAIPADCSCFLTSTSSTVTTLKTPTTTTTVAQETGKIVTSTIKTTITISNVGTTLTSTWTTLTTYISTLTATDDLTSTISTSTDLTITTSATTSLTVTTSVTTTATSTVTVDCPSDLSFNNNNCGACGNVCPDGTACYNDACAITCTSSVGCDSSPTCGVGTYNCLCNTIAEGGIVCFDFPDFSCSYQACSMSTDCPAGQGCVTDTCCSNPFCVPINQCGNIVAPKFLFKKAFGVVPRTGEYSHFTEGSR